jgi:hypothetical protein
MLCNVKDRFALQAGINICAANFEVGADSRLAALSG